MGYQETYPALYALGVLTLRHLTNPRLVLEKKGDLLPLNLALGGIYEELRRNTHNFDEKTRADWGAIYLVGAAEYLQIQSEWSDDEGALVVEEGSAEGIFQDRGDCREKLDEVMDVLEEHSSNDAYNYRRNCLVHRLGTQVRNVWLQKFFRNKGVVPLPVGLPEALELKVASR